MTNNQHKNDKLTIRINSGDKQSFCEIVQKFGLNPTEAINMFIKTVIEEKSLAPIFYYHDKSEILKNEKIAKNVRAVEEFIKGINESKDEILGQEFDEIMAQRFNISGDLDTTLNATDDERIKKREAFEKFFKSVEDNNQEVLDDIAKYRINLEKN